MPNTQMQTVQTAQSTRTKNLGGGRPATMHKSPERRTVLKRYVTDGYLRRLFRRTEATVYQWREMRGLPYVEIPGDSRPTIRFYLPHVLAWAGEHKIRTYVVPDSP